MRDFTYPKTKDYSYWYHTKLDQQLPAGLVYFHVTRFYCMELIFLNYENSLSPLDPVDNKRHKFL